MTEIDGLMKFDNPKERPSIIKVLGVGGGGSNAVNHMFKQGIHGVDFIICNTDAQAIEMSPVPSRIQLGVSLTDGNGAGSRPEVGKNATIENLEDIRDALSGNTKMLFITAGMGGGTGTGGAPVIAKMAREMGILTIAIVTIPFFFEGRKRRQVAEQGIQELRQNVDTLLVINNDKLRELHGNLVINDAFGKADDVLTEAAKGIAEIITHIGHINVDFEDVKTVMKDSGVAIMGTGIASGDNRAAEAVEAALSSPLLNDNQINGASNVLLYINSGTKGIRMDEVTEITDYIQEEAGSSAEIIWGHGSSDELGENIAVTIIATGFNAKSDFSTEWEGRRSAGVVVGTLEKETATHLQQTTVKSQQEDFQIVTRGTPISTEPVVFGTKPFKSDTINELPVVNAAEPVAENDNQEMNIQPENVTMTLASAQQEPMPLNSQPTPSGPARSGHDLKHQERISRLKDLTLKIQSLEGVIELEEEPAYLRRRVELSQQHHSSQKEGSRYTLNDGEITDNNFLHGGID